MFLLRWTSTSLLGAVKGFSWVGPLTPIIFPGFGCVKFEPRKSTTWFFSYSSKSIAIRYVSSRDPSFLDSCTSWNVQASTLSSGLFHASLWAFGPLSCSLGNFSWKFAMVSIAMPSQSLFQIFMKPRLTHGLSDSAFEIFEFPAYRTISPTRLPIIPKLFLSFISFLDTHQKSATTPTTPDHQLNLHHYRKRHGWVFRSF